MLTGSMSNSSQVNLILLINAEFWLTGRMRGHGVKTSAGSPTGSKPSKPSAKNGQIRLCLKLLALKHRTYI